jgi:CheY-like chemotaxis protein
MFLIAVTGWGQEEDKRRSREAGFNVHLVKPVDLDAFLEVLKSIEHFWLSVARLPREAGS